MKLVDIIRDLSRTESQDNSGHFIYSQYSNFLKSRSDDVTLNDERLFDAFILNAFLHNLNDKTLKTGALCALPGWAPVDLDLVWSLSRPLTPKCILNDFAFNNLGEGGGALSHFTWLSKKLNHIGVFLDIKSLVSNDLPEDVDRIIELVVSKLKCKSISFLVVSQKGRLSSIELRHHIDVFNIAFLDRSVGFLGVK